MASSYKYLSENDKVVSSVDLTTDQSLVKADFNKQVRPDQTVTSNSLFYIYGSGSNNVEKLGVSYGSGSSNGSVAGYDKAAARIYDQYAHTLLGYDAQGQLKTFHAELTSALNENLAFLTFPRSLVNDKIAQNSVSVVLNSNTATEFGSIYGVQTGNCRLLASGSVVSGAVFYEAGVIVINSSSITNINTALSMASASNLVTSSLTSVAFKATTELNSTVYFCRAYNNEFNYSSNPTYLKNSEIVVKNGDPNAEPAAYITTVGLYDDANQLLAVAKLSEPIKKTASTELIVRARLDF